MTDVELDERVTALEENVGGGTENGKLNDKFMHVSLLRPRSHLAMATQIFDVVTIIFYVITDGLYCHQCKCSHMTTEKKHRCRQVRMDPYI